MTDSDGDTQPCTPESVAEQIVNSQLNDIFAWVRPHTPDACVAFDAIAGRAFKNPQKYEHVRRFLYFDNRREQRASSTYTEDSETQELDAPQWSGAFKLSLKTQPRDPSKGWYLGSSSEAADFVLAPSRKGHLSTTGIAGRHIRLYLHPESHRVVLEARHTVTVTKNAVRILRESKSQVLEHGELFMMNNHGYTFELTDLFATPEFEEELCVFMRKSQGLEWSMNKLLSPTSVGMPSSIGNYYCSPSAFAQGTFGKISAGWSQEGRAVAIKVFKNPRESDILSHQQLMRHVGNHVRGLLRKH